jgi:pimeloyl-ACP methyl ester carboxylesterase
MNEAVRVSERIDVPVLGGTLATFRLGVASPDAPPILAVHGITSNSRSWLPTARELGSQATVLAPDLRGRARSNDLGGPYGMEAHARDMVAILDHLGIERAVLVGHSLGGYIVARIAADHPSRVAAAVLVDGGLSLPGTDDVDPQEFLSAFLGPAVARLEMTFESREAYHAWWRRHPSFSDADVADEDLIAYADHDLIGSPPQMHSSVLVEAVRGDGGELLEMGKAAHRLSLPAKLLCAPRGLLNEDNPMQPMWLAEQWAAEAPADREAILVPDVNHYSITLGRRGARAVAEVVAQAVGVAV